MSLTRNVDPADHAMSVADQDPPSIPVGVPPPRAPLEDRSGQQLVQWLSVQADQVTATECAHLDGPSIFAYAVFRTTQG